MGVLAIAGFALTSCLGPLKYGPMAENNGLGYRDRQNPDGSYTILVVANDSATAQQFWDRRAQELCGDANFHKNIFRAEVPVVMTSGYVANPYGGGGSYTSWAHGAFYLEGYLHCDADHQTAASGAQPAAHDVAAGASAAAASPAAAPTTTTP